MNGIRSRIVAIAGVALALSAFADTADARRGGSFGSRGSRTYAAPPPTRTAPTQAAPIQRSMTTPTATGQQPGARQASPATQTPAMQPQRRNGFLGGLGGGILGGLLMGGLIGALMGNGFGAGAAGMMSLLFQLGLAALVVAVVVKLLQRRRQPAAAGGAPLDWAAAAARRDAPSAGFERQAPAYPASATPTVEAVDVTAADKDAFERLLIEIQDAFAREDYSALRARTTPEIMSYLAEELSENATSGRRNDVSDTQLLEADIAESWREDDLDYATAALRYQNVDIMRDRQSGAVLSGDPGRATQTTELWTFVRRRGEDWKLSAIQEA